MLTVKEQTGSIVVNAGTMQLNVQGLASLAIDLSGTFVGTVIFEYTINGKDWYTLTTTVVGATTTATGATAAGKWLATVAGFLAVRVRCSAYTSGTMLVALRAVLSGGGSSGGSGGVTYNATPPTLTDGQSAPTQADANGNTKVTLASLLAGEDLTNNKMVVEMRYTPFLITTQTTTVVKSGAGFLQNLIIPTPVASATIKVYDNTAASGTVLIDTITLPATLVSDGPIPIPCGYTFATGLTIVTAGATMSVVGGYR